MNNFKTNFTKNFKKDHTNTHTFPYVPLRTYTRTYSPIHTHPTHVHTNVPRVTRIIRITIYTIPKITITTM